MSLLDHIDEKIDEKRFDQIAEAQKVQLEDWKPTNTKLDVFKDILPSVLKTKKHILENEKDYNPYLVNHMVSMHDDAILYANEMNMLHQLPKRLQYDFYFYGLRSKSRPFVKWYKPAKQEDLDAVKKYFGYSDAKAKQTLNILSEDQLVLIREITTAGE